MKFYEARLMRVIIAGSRHIRNRPFVEQCIAWAREYAGINVTEVIGGLAPGPDTIGQQWAADNGIPFHGFPANWAKGLDAGLIRNCKMRAYGEGLIAVWDGRSTGTKHMIEQMVTYGKPYYYFDLAIGDHFYGNNAGREGKERRKETTEGA
jgi:hypothetical protein